MAENLNVSLVLKDIAESEEARSELLELVKETKTPFFVDNERGVSLSESSDIIDYLREYGKQTSPITVNRPRVHVGGSVCESCEG